VGYQQDSVGAKAVKPGENLPQKTACILQLNVNVFSSIIADPDLIGPKNQNSTEDKNCIIKQKIYIKINNYNYSGGLESYG
jgi:hypothetical protein